MAFSLLWEASQCNTSLYFPMLHLSEKKSRGLDWSFLLLVREEPHHHSRSECGHGTFSLPPTTIPVLAPSGIYGILGVMVERWLSKKCLGALFRWSIFARQPKIGAHQYGRCLRVCWVGGLAWFYLSYYRHMARELTIARRTFFFRSSLFLHFLLPHSQPLTIKQEAKKMEMFRWKGSLIVLLKEIWRLMRFPNLYVSNNQKLCCFESDTVINAFK